MVTQVREVERKYEAPVAQGQVPLEGLPGVVAVGDPVTHQLDAVYYDTADLRLAARGTRLRRRTGGTDAGWHLKRPASKGATLELRASLGPPGNADGDAPAAPAELAVLVHALTRGAALAPVVRVLTRRVEVELRGADGVLALVADDEVTVEQLGRPDAAVGFTDGPAPAPAPGVSAQTWREVEVELVDGTEDLLVAVEERLLGAGLRPAQAASKAARAFGERVRPAWPPLDDTAPPVDAGSVERGEPDDGATQGKAAKGKRGKAAKGKAARGKGGKRASATATGDRRAGAPAATPSRSAGAVLCAYLREQVSAVLDQDPRARRDEHDAVHKMRVATRRLRSALRTYRPLLDEEATTPLGAELRWLAGVLGEVRDVEVLQKRLLDDIAELPGELVLGPVAARVRREMAHRYRGGRERMLAELSGARYFALLDALDRLVVSPPLTDAARGPAEQVLPGLVRRAHRRLDRRLDALPALGSGRDAQRDVELHEARKDAKRLRYAAESVARVFGADATALATRAEALQELLGDHQDGVVLTPVLRQLAVEAHGASENGFTFGLLLGQERCRAAAVHDKLDGVRAPLADRRARRWLRAR